MKVLNDDLIEFVYISIDDEEPRNTTLILTGEGKQSLIRFIPDEIKHEDYPDRFGGKIVLRFRKEAVKEYDWYSEETQEKLQDLEAECEDINPPAEDNDPIQD